MMVCPFAPSQSIPSPLHSRDPRPSCALGQSAPESEPLSFLYLSFPILARLLKRMKFEFTSFLTSDRVEEYCRRVTVWGFRRRVAPITCEGYM